MTFPGAGVMLPNALQRKYPNAPKEWRWQWVFPQLNRWKDHKTGEEGRHHADQSILQKAFRQALIKSGLTKHAPCHALRHYSELGISATLSPYTA